MKRCVLVALLLALTTATGSSMAASDTATDLRAVAEQAVRAQYAQAGSRVVIVPEKLNPHLRLAPCPQALQARLPTRQ
ncbi:MAG: flagellar biosynthesis protein FlgA, partial [Rhodanobacter sp.]